MSDLFADELQRLLELERRLLDEVMPHLRARARSTSLRAALDRHLVETRAHVANLEHVIALADVAPAGTDGELAALATMLRAEAAEVASYTFLVHAAAALGAGDDTVRLLRLNMEQDELAGEQARAALVEVLAVKVADAEAV